MKTLILLLTTTLFFSDANAQTLHVILNHPLVVSYSSQPKDFPTASDEMVLAIYGVSKFNFIVKNGTVYTAAQIVRMEPTDQDALFKSSYCQVSVFSGVDTTQDITFSTLELRSNEGPYSSFSSTNGTYTATQSRRYFSLTGEKIFGLIRCVTTQSGATSDFSSQPWELGADLSTQFNGTVKVLQP